jgi:hypothetical protein
VQNYSKHYNGFQVPNEIVILKEINQNLIEVNNSLLRILQYLAIPKGISIKEKEKMGKFTHAVSLDVQIQDNGTAIFTATIVDSLGNPTVLPVGTPPLSWSDSAAVLKFVTDPSDTSGFNLVMDATPTGLTTGDVVSASFTLVGGSLISASYPTPIDVVAGGPAGLTIQESGGTVTSNIKK